MRNIADLRNLNMIKILIIWKGSNVFDFGYLEDGRIQLHDLWYDPIEFQGWWSLEDLRNKLLENDQRR